MRKKKMTSFDQFATAICENIARNLGLPKIEVLLRRQKHADARKRSATMKRVIATALAVAVCGPALGADADNKEMIGSSGFWKCQGSDGTTVYQDFDCSLKSKPDAPSRPAPEPVNLHIGMTSFDAKMTDYPWGKPRDVNTTTTARGTREQWVYSGHRYLYFENGILTAISN